MALRRVVHALGGRFRVHVKDLPGTPDMANKRARVAVFVDGCFWHGCPRHFKLPKTRRAFWREKIRRNREKRRRVLAEYPARWIVLQIHECKLEASLKAYAARIFELLDEAED